MVGLCAVLGAGSLPAETAAWTRWSEAESHFAYSDERVELTLSAHDLLAGDQPAVADDDVFVWLWGDVYGHGSGDDYEPRDGAPDGGAAYCARRYRESGLSFVEDLNGEFALVVYDRSQRRLALVTDRFATHPLYAATPSDDTMVVASRVQALPTHPEVDATFDREYLHEFLSLRRVFGVETPLVGVRELPPASVTEVDLTDCSTETTTYWRPHYDPVEKPFSYFVDRLADVFETLFDEWMHDDLTYGVLLSGGSDSRFVRACMDGPCVAFHNADWMNREATVASRIADVAGDEFRLLERSDDHEARSLGTTPALSDFSGWFDQAYFTEFADDITDSVDVLVSGLFADMLFGGGPLPTRSVSLGPVGTLSLPVRRAVDDVDDYVDAQLADGVPLPYFDADRPLREVVADNIHETDDHIVSHGVRYESLTDLLLYGDYYPLSADTEAIFPRSLAQMRPYRTPFFDNRVVDLHSRMPMRYFLRRNVVDAALSKVSPPLASVPHARTGVPPKYPFPVEYLGTTLYGFHRKHVRDDPVPEPHLSHDPWPDREALLRARPFAADFLREHDALLHGLHHFDADAAHRTLDDHRDGTNHTVALYSLLTLLGMPVTERTVATRGSPQDAVARSDGGSGSTRGRR